MKILVCTDGSPQSMKAIEEAVKIAGGCNADEVSVIHVYEKNLRLPAVGEGYHATAKDLERFKKVEEQNREESKNMVSKAVEIFEKNGIKADTIFKEGHPAETITQVAREKGFDMLVVGSRGLGGLKKLFLGSVSNAILQEVDTNVLVVK